MTQIDKREMIERIEDVYVSLIDAIVHTVDAIESEDNLDIAWTPKDILAHIAAWEHVLVQFHIGGRPFEEVIEMPGSQYHVTSFDDVNAHLFEMYKGWSLEKVEQFAEQTHNEMMELLNDLPENVYNEPAASIVEIGLDPYPMHEYIAANTYEHYTEHLETIL